MNVTLSIKRTIAIVLTVFSLVILIPGAAFAAHQSADDIFFKQLTDQSYAAWNTHDPEAIADFFVNDPELVVYDATPLKYEGWQEFKAGIQTHLFDKLNRFELSTHDDLRATRNGN
ncbi:MAG: hypothetical protein AAFU78_23580, partial [Cyanobacteria bacterium J06633_2]